MYSNVYVMSMDGALSKCVWMMTSGKPEVHAISMQTQAFLILEI